MANTYLSLYVHLVFAVKEREGGLIAVYRPRIYEYLKQTARNLGQFPIAVGGTDNHLHMLLGYKPTVLLADLVRELKTSSTKFINNDLVLSRRFEWQRGYGAFSHSYRDIEAVKNYIMNQTEHHNDESFATELRRMLDRSGIAYDERYLLEDV